jgi:hypothetical protein
VSKKVKLKIKGLKQSKELKLNQGVDWEIEEKRES